MKTHFLIAAPSSNSGKTTVTLGLLRILKERGYSVQPFKCGPDYIDTKHHTFAAGKPSINLDTFMMSVEHVENLFSKYGNNSDLSIVEGVMGLFDGANKMQGSSAEIAILLDLPVILVVNAKATAYSVAPLIYGFKNFNPKIKIAGVIFNFVNTESHYSFLKDACEDIGVESLGYIPSNENIKIPSRYLGLDISSETNFEKIIQQAAIHIEKTVNIDRLIEICQVVEKDITETIPIDQNNNLKKLKILVAKDEAFNFIYPENIEALKKMGEIKYFSPLNDEKLPEADLVYLAGGYPELFLSKLSSNLTMKNEILNYCNNGGKLIAECGGMMYLGENIIDKDGNAFPMIGFLGLNTSMENSKLSLGYRKIKIEDHIFKGHEFHYSSCLEVSTTKSVGKVCNAKGLEIETPIYQKENVIASYIHFYWGEEIVFLNHIMNV